MKPYLPHCVLGIGLLLWLTLFVGCASRQALGTLALEPKYNEGPTLERLQRDWEEYHVYYIGRFEGSPTAMVFDPKGDDRELRQSDWTRALDSQTVQNVLGWIRNTQIHPRLHQVLGPDGQFFGYLYSAWDNNVLVRLVDEGALAVYVQGVPVYF